MASRKVLRLTADEIADLVIRNRAEAIARRAEWLKSHPDYIPCVVKECEGLVGPRFQRQTDDGRAWGFCPRRATHQRLAPAAFPAA